MGVLDHLVYFIDQVPMNHCLIHLVCGAFFGLVLGGYLFPAQAFWSASLVGFVKETIDYFKHTAESATFDYLTDTRYGLYDGLGDLLFWMIGGYLSYRLLSVTYRRAQMSTIGLNQHK